MADVCPTAFKVKKGRMMSGKDLDGQLDFLGLISEYTDDQGAHVKVREPGVRRIKPIPPPEPEQLSFEIEAKTAEAEAEAKAAAEAEAKAKAEAEARAKAEAEAEAKAAAKAEAKAKAAAEAEAKVKAEAEAKAAAEAEAKAKAEAEARAKAEAEVKAEAEKKVRPKPQAKPAKSSGNEIGVMNFKACERCWCHDCKHNALGKAVPRDICGTTMPCPACQSCIDEDTPTICEIGNAKEGCMTRAMEEGIPIN